MQEAPCINYQAIGDAVIVTDEQGAVEGLNPCQSGKPSIEILRIIFDALRESTFPDSVIVIKIKFIHGQTHTPENVCF